VGSTWQPLPAVSSAAALLLPSTASLRFVTGSQGGTATLTFQGWDQTQGTAGGTFNIASDGGATAFSTASTTVSLAVHQAPSWSASTGASLTSLLPGTYSTSIASSPAGNTVAAVFGSYFQDSNPAVSVGVAVVGLTGASSGAWQYSLTGGGSWITLPATTATTSAVLLSATDLIRFVPNNNFAGTVSLKALAWDGSAGTRANTVNLSAAGSTGGTTAFSAAVLTASCIVNTAPILSITSVSLAAVNENVTSPAVTAGTLLTKAGYSDADGKLVPSGIAIIGSKGSGTWQWLNGSTWMPLPTVSSTVALLLPSTGQVRFLPANNLPVNTNGTATLTYLAWDQTVGAPNKTFALTSQGRIETSRIASMTDPP